MNNVKKKLHFSCRMASLMGCLYSEVVLDFRFGHFPACSEPSGHKDSPGATFYIPYQFKNLSKSRLSDPFFELFLVISEVGSQIYIANLAIFKI